VTDFIGLALGGLIYAWQVLHHRRQRHAPTHH